MRKDAFKRYSIYVLMGLSLLSRAVDLHALSHDGDAEANCDICLFSVYNGLTPSIVSEPLQVEFEQLAVRVGRAVISYRVSLFFSDATPSQLFPRPPPMDSNNSCAVA